MSESPNPIRPWWQQPPLWIGAVPLLLFLLLSAVDLDAAKQFTQEGQTLVSNLLGGTWQWMVVALFLIAVVLAVSPVGGLRLGGPDAKPNLRFFDWCSVLICTLLAGGGVFWSAAEPLFHYLTPSPVFSDVTGKSPAAVDPALAVSFLHWGFLAWALVATTTTITNSGATRRTSAPPLTAGEHPSQSVGGRSGRRPGRWTVGGGSGRRNRWSAWLFVTATQ